MYNKSICSILKIVIKMTLVSSIPLVNKNGHHNIDFNYSIIAFNSRVVQAFTLHYVKFKSTTEIILHFLLNTCELCVYHLEIQPNQFLLQR